MEKYLFLLWYSACVDNLQHGTFTINGREVSFAPLFNNDEPSGKSLGWLGTLFNLAERRTFGDLKETSATGIIDILLLLLNDKYNADNARKTIRLIKYCQNINAGMNNIPAPILWQRKIKDR